MCEGGAAKKLFRSSSPWVGFINWSSFLEGELKGPFLENTLEETGVASWLPVLELSRERGPAESQASACAYLLIL